MNTIRKLFIIIVLASVVSCSQESPTPEKKQAAEIPLITNDSWKIFRGTRQLTGVSSSLSNKNIKSAEIKLVWKFKTEDQITGTAVIDHGKVFIGSGNGKMYALDLKSGKRLWEFDTQSGIEASAAIDGKNLYLGTIAGDFYALDTKSGKKIWHFKTEDKIAGAPNIAELQEKKYILFGCYDDKLYCLDSNTGKKVWDFATKSFINGTPAILNGRVYFGGCDSNLRVLSIKTGKEINTIDAGSYLPSSPAISDNKVLAALYAGELICVSTDKIEKLWTYADEENDAHFFASPAVSAGTVIIGSRNNYLYAIDLQQGKLKWKFKSNGEIDSSAVISDGLAMFGGKDGRFYLIAINDGSVAGKYDLGESISASPAIADGMVIIGSEEGTVFALDVDGEK